MENVPKIVRDRLQQGTPVTAESHPDANLLTAFAEHSLAGRERDHVLQHLAQCGDCRETVALALPAEVEYSSPGGGGSELAALAGSSLVRCCAGPRWPPAWC